MKALTDAEIRRMVLQWFVGVERRAVEWWEQEGQLLDEGEVNEIVDTLRVDEAVYSGGGKNHLPADGSSELDAFLAETGIDCPKNSAAYRTLLNVFRLGRLENLRRTLDRVERKPFQAREPLFRDVHSHSRLSEPESITLGELLDRYMNYVKAHRATTTYLTYQTPVKVIRSVMGEKTRLNDISRAEIEQLCAVLKEMPVNAKQKYPGMTPQQAIAAAKKKGDARKLSGKALENYFANIMAVFNFAVDEKFMRENPAKYRSLREQFRNTEKRRKALFTTEELNALFRAPLYIGCANDAEGFATPGKNVIRRGRFWLPVLGLFQGLRMNEAAQIYLEDVREEDGIPYLAIRTELDGEDKTDKRLKNRASKRNVPMHPEIVRMGFLKFVAERRRKGDSPRLFPELVAGKTGRYSNPFSKWFSRFLETTFDVRPKATYHSLRHHFRDALRAGRVGDENVEALGGWSGEGKQQREYGKGPSLRMLAEDISKVEYPGLNLAHLRVR